MVGVESMRTKRLYFDDSYLTHFTSELLAKKQLDGNWHLLLAESAFYPTSGGQPHDCGRLGDLPVLDVYEEGHLVWHIVPDDPGEGPLVGEVDFSRRYDFMQQHTGQHILSQAFWRRLQATTIGFHLTEHSLTIDLDVERLNDADLHWVEQECNRLIWSNARVVSHWCNDAQLAAMPLRKPPQVTEDIRVIETEGYDWSPCGGTHVASSAEVGLIKIRRWERAKGVTRVEFFCGQRALEDYNFKNGFCLQMATDLSIKDRDLPSAWQRQQTLLREAEQALRHTREELVGFWARELHREALQLPGFRLVCQRVAASDFSQLRQLSQALAALPETVAILAMTTGSTQVALARSTSLEQLNLAVLAKPLLAQFAGKGGGTPQGVQGALSREEDLEAFMQLFADALHEQH